MSLPIPPSDNLYKFVAIFGLILFLTPFVFATQDHYYSSQLAFELTRRSDHRFDLMAESLKLETAEQRELHEKMLQDVKQNEQELIEAFGIKRKAFIESVDRIFLCQFTVSLLMMAAGFYFWYVKVQKQQDVIQDAQAETAKLELKKLRTPQ